MLTAKPLHRAGPRISKGQRDLLTKLHKDKGANHCANVSGQVFCSPITGRGINVFYRDRQGIFDFHWMRKRDASRLISALLDGQHR